MRCDVGFGFDIDTSPSLSRAQRCDTTAFTRVGARTSLTRMLMQSGLILILKRRMF